MAQKAVTLQVRIPEKLNAALKAKAEEMGVDRSSLTRMLIAAAIDPPLARFWTNYNRTVQALKLELKGKQPALIGLLPNKARRRRR